MNEPGHILTAIAALQSETVRFEARHDIRVCALHDRQEIFVLLRGWRVAGGNIGLTVTLTPSSISTTGGRFGASLSSMASSLARSSEFSAASFAISFLSVMASLRVAMVSSGRGRARASIGRQRCIGSFAATLAAGGDETIG